MSTGFPPAAAYPAPGYVPFPQVSKRNQLVFVVSIIMIFGGAVGLFINLLALPNADYFAYVIGISVSAYRLLLLFMMLSNVIELLVGIFGVKGASDLSKASLLFNLGIAILAFTGVNVVLSIFVLRNSAFIPVVGFLLPVLFFVGANQMKKEAAVPINYWHG